VQASPGTTMMNKLYRNNQENITPEEVRQRRINLSLSFRAANKYINPKTGEIKEPFHSKFNRKSRRAIKKKLENPNSVPNKIRQQHGDNLKFYTLLLKDIFPSWAEYDVLFLHERIEKVKNYIRRHIIGSFFAVFEISSFSGPHVHLVCVEQNSIFAKRNLKAMKDIYNFEGLVNYLSKSCIAEDDRFTEEADFIQGVYLECKAQIIGKRAPTLSLWRVKNE
jgi:hypothetical protein